MTTAAIYARISFDRTGEGAGVERQEVECRALAARLGLTVTQVFVDNDVSATSGASRPEFERMLAERPAAIITWAQDRLLRLSADLEKVINLNVPVHMVTQGSLDLATPAGRAVARTVAAWSTFETEQKALRQTAANDQRAAKGLPTTRPGYGYRRVGGRDVIAPEEARTIHRIASRVLNGDALRSIAKDLNDADVPSPMGAPWQGVTVRQLILRPSLAGLRVHRGTIVGEFDPELHPRILERDTHDRLVSLLKNPARRTNGVGRPPQHLLSGIALCGKCGGRMLRMTGREASTQTGKKRQPSAYGCPTCFGVRRKQDVVDAFVEETLLRRLEKADARDLLPREDADVANQATHDIAAIDARLGEAADAFSDGRIDLAQLTRITDRLRGEREAKRAVLERSFPLEFPRGLAGPSARGVWRDLSLTVRRQIVELLAEVTILPSGSGRPFDPELIRIRWRTPSSKPDPGTGWSDERTVS